MPSQQVLEILPPEQHILLRLKSAPLPWVSVNAYSSDRVPLCLPFLSMNRGGMRIAVIGLTDDSSVHQDFIVTDGAEEISKILPELHDSHDMIILLTTISHEKALQLTKKFPEIDVIIGGDARKGNIKGFLAGETLLTPDSQTGKIPRQSADYLA